MKFLKTYIQNCSKVREYFGDDNVIFVSLESRFFNKATRVNHNKYTLFSEIECYNETFLHSKVMVFAKFSEDAISSAFRNGKICSQIVSYLKEKVSMGKIVILVDGQKDPTVRNYYAKIFEQHSSMNVEEIRMMEINDALNLRMNKPVTLILTNN